MKKAKILVAVSALVAVGAAAFASKATLRAPFYKPDAAGICSITTSVFLTNVKPALNPTTVHTQLSVAPTTTTCPVITLYSAN